MLDKYQLNRLNPQTNDMKEALCLRPSPQTGREGWVALLVPPCAGAVLATWKVSVINELNVIQKTERQGAG